MNQGIGIRIQTTSRLARARAFAIQFTSCMLLILTFIVGAYSRPTEEPDKSGQLETVTAPRNGTSQIGEMQFTDLFKTGEGSVNPDQLSALASVLTQHDVDAEIEVYGCEPDTCRPEEERLTLAVSRAAGLTRKLYKANVPRHAVKVFANEREESAHAYVRFFRVRDNGI